MENKNYIIFLYKLLIFLNKYYFLSLIFGNKITFLAIKYLRPEYFIFLIIIMFYCTLCDYKTSNNSNYPKHLRTKKHIENSTKNSSNNIHNVEKMSKLLKKK